MDNIQDEDDARREIAPLADKLGFSHTALLTLILVVIVASCILSVLIMWHLHRRYRNAQQQANPCREDVKCREDAARHASGCWTEFPSPRHARTGLRLNANEVDSAMRGEKNVSASKGY